MMQYIGIQKQIRKNNINSALLLIAFPMILIGMTFVIMLFMIPPGSGDAYQSFLSVIPIVLGATLIWFLIAWMFHTSMINAATGARPLERRDNKRVYNLVENLCVAQGIKTPKLYIIEDSSLNAYASGINESNFAVTLSRGIIEKLNDDELEGVIAHELTHIQNRDVRLLVVSVIFVGIFAFIAQMASRSIYFTGRNRDGKSNAPIVLLIIVISFVAYFISMLLRFGISRSREYMADAGAAEMTRKPHALASALRKISADPLIEAVSNHDVAQMFIDNPQPKEKKLSLASLFATHPPIKERIRLLEQYS